MTPEEEAIVLRVESFRSQLAARTDRAASFVSPHSGTFTVDDLGHALPGAMTTADMAAHAATGVKPVQGVLLRRLAEGLGAKRVLELGTNTGFSGCYFLSARTEPYLATVEGSAELAEIARGHLAQFSGRFSVLNMLFDEALDSLTGEQFDMAFLDGQHEREATLHYTDRLLEVVRPGGALIYDDLYWSDDMLSAWRVLCRDQRFSVAIDLGWKGVVFVGESGGRNSSPLVHDIAAYAGNRRVVKVNW